MTTDSAESPVDSIDPESPKLAKKKTKTFTGCATCRSRKIKCDLRKPSCQRCAKSGLVCAGYQIVLCWSRPLEFDKYGRQIRNSIFPEDDSVKGFQRRSIDFVKYDREYEMYDEMDRDLALLHSPDYVKIDNNQTMLEGPFGVFEGNNDIDAAAKRKKRKITRGRPVSLQTLKEAQAHSSPLQNSVSLTELQPPSSTTSLSVPVSYLRSPSGSTPPVSDQRIRSQRTQTRNTQHNTGTSRPLGSNNEWLSNELRFDALLSATAATSNEQNNFFFDFLYPYSNPNSNKSVDTTSTFTGLVNKNEMFPFDHQVFNALKPHEIKDPLPLDAQQLPNPVNDGTDTESVPEIQQPKDQEAKHPYYYLFDNGDLKISETIIQIVETKIFPELSSTLNVPIQGMKITSLARFLLNNYYETVADKMSVVPFDSNPWKSIYFPRAVQALGDLSALGRTSNSKLSVLHALLAVSCFCLQSKFEKSSTEMKFFLNLGIEFRSQASIFLKKVLTNNQGLDKLFDSKVEKYKDVLVAILSMNTIDVVWGTMADCQYYLSLCEQIISKRTAERPQLSNKAKILHRVFSFLKLLQDSTNLKNLSGINEDLKSKFINRLIEAKNNGNTTEFYENVDQDGIIEIGFINKAMINGEYKPEFIDEKTSKIKTHKHVFLTDALYGLPNSLILLFSETVKMIKIKLYLDKNPNQSDSSKLLQISKNFEKKLLSWKTEWKLQKDNSEDFLTDLHQGIFHHSMGFYNALIIYYFTMVQNLDHKNLQIYSSGCINHLEILQDMVTKGRVEILPMIWQGFIGGCAAVDSDLQNRYREWTSYLAQNGVGSYWGARQIMFEVWRRRENNEMNDNWLSVHNDWEMNIMLA